MYSRKNIEFKVDDITLRGWFYTPKVTPAPCVIMTHGFSALKEHYLDKFALRFAEAGMNVLVYDNRSFGESDGEPRLEVDAVAQIRDMRNAITFVQKLNVVDSKRIGIWGTSFSGGVVLAVASLDKRVTCVVSQVPFISGHHKFIRSTRPEKWEETQKMYQADRRARAEGKAPAMIAVVTNDPKKSAIMKQLSAYSFFTSVNSWKNEVTLKSVENSGEFEPINYVNNISPTPVLFIVANKDTVNTTDLALDAYDKALEPKKLVLIQGEHFVPYVEQFDICVKTASEWFQQHLLANSLTNAHKRESDSFIKAKL